MHKKVRKTQADHKLHEHGVVRQLYSFIVEPQQHSDQVPIKEVSHTHLTKLASSFLIN